MPIARVKTCSFNNAAYAPQGGLSIYSNAGFFWAVISDRRDRRQRKDLPEIHFREERMLLIGDRIREDVLVLLDLPGGEVNRMRTIIRSQPELFDKYSTCLDVYATELRKNESDAFCQQEDALNVLLYVRLAEILAMGVSKGLYRRVDPLVAARALISTIESLAFDMIGQLDKEEAKEESYKVERLFVDGLLGVSEP
jgi:hypothetical protein